MLHCCGTLVHLSATLLVYVGQIGPSIGPIVYSHLDAGVALRPTLGKTVLTNTVYYRASTTNTENCTERLFGKNYIVHQLAAYCFENLSG